MFFEPYQLDAKLSYTWVDAEIEGGAFDGSKIPLVPEDKLRLSVEYRPSDPVLIVLGATFTDQVYVGSDFDNTESQLSDYLLWDLLIGICFLAALAPPTLKLRRAGCRG
ncbi:MAG TPA: hypothetical protein DCY38_00110 [Opitutae bacterium]|nr:hypothetical protein [Opitutae bacterium]